MIEILTGPKQVGRFDLAQEYKHILTHFPNLIICGLDEKIVDTASNIRAKYNIATPDAIHIATAIENSATEFLTNDKRLKKIKEIQISLV